MNHLLDHGLPLVALKEQRREMVIGLVGHSGPLSKELIRDLAAVHSTIAAIEAVIADLDQDLSACFANSVVPHHIAN